MIKFSTNVLLATSALCAMTTFTKYANAEYVPTRGETVAAYEVSAGDAGSYDFYIIGEDNEKIYYKWALNNSKVASHSITITAVSEEKPGTGKYFAVPHKIDDSGNPVLTYYSYVASDADGHYSDSIRKENPTEVNEQRFITVSTGNFLGGAIFNNSDISTDIVAEFINNNAYSDDTGWDAQGGAIFNSGTTKNISGDFVDNSAYNEADPKWAYGGAIYNNYSGAIENINSNFVANYVSSEFGAALGGAVYNGHDRNSDTDPFASIGNITGDFIGNYARAKNDAKGGVIYNGSTMGNVTGDFINNYTYSSSLWAYGGAVYNIGNAGDISGNFVNNTSYSANAAALGGAIYNGEGESAIKNIAGDFIGNYTYSASLQDTDGSLGGAVHNSGSIISIFGNFIGNYNESSTNAHGGAIYNNGSIASLSGDFVDNYSLSTVSKVHGGAIYNEKTILMLTNGSAEDADVLFKDNYIQVGAEDKQYEAIYNKGLSAALTFKSINDGTYTFYDYINGDGAGTINFVSDDKDGATFNLYNDIKGQANINFQNKYVLNMLSPDVTHDNTSNFSILQSTNITISSAIQMAVDVDLATKEMDHFVAENFVIDGGAINVYKFNIINDAVEKVTEVPFIVLADDSTIAANTSGLNLITPDVATEVIGSAFTYDVYFDDTTGNFVFTKTGLAPDIYTGKLNAAASTMTQTVIETISTQVLNRDISENAGMNSGDAETLSTWVQVFGSNDDIKLKHLPGTIDTQFHGVIGGVDSKRFAYDNGLSAVYGVYGAYTGSRQKYDDNKINQKGGYLGVLVSFRKDRVFNNLTLNGGFLANETDTEFGKDKFDTKVVSVANKTGVDFKHDELTFTPALTLGYMGIDTDDYTAKSGVKVDNKFMNVFTVAPELKVTKDFGVGFEGYTKASYKMFFYDNNKVEANDVLLPDLSVKPYLEYGLGLTKDWSQEEWNPKDITSYAEITRHDGGREGWDVNLGLKLDF